VAAAGTISGAPPMHLDDASGAGDTASNEKFETSVQAHPTDRRNPSGGDTTVMFRNRKLSSLDSGRPIHANAGLTSRGLVAATGGYTITFTNSTS